MAPPGNGIYVVRGELSVLMTAMRRGARWNSSSHHEDDVDPLSKSLHDLKAVLSQIEDLRVIDPNVFLQPFLNIIRSADTTGPVTTLALAAVNKFLSYGLIDPTHSSIAATVENIADSVTHARFVGTDQASDGVVLMKIVGLIKTLMLSPEGNALTNESVCDLMLSCFRITFETRLNELLRRTAEQALKDIVLLLFMRLPQFVEEKQNINLIKKLKMIAESDTAKKKSKKSKDTEVAGDSEKSLSVSSSSTRPAIIVDQSDDQQPKSPTVNTLKPPPLATTPATPAGNIVDMQGKISQTPCTAPPPKPALSGSVENIPEQPTTAQDEDEDKFDDEEEKNRDFVNSVGVRFTPEAERDSETELALVPYGLPCIRELFRFLISLCNPADKQNSDTMIHTGLSLLTVALEIGADSIGKYASLLRLVRDEMCRNLFALLNTDRVTIFAADVQLCFLVFESLRANLKFQFEHYLSKLSDIIGCDTARVTYDTREITLDHLLQLWRIPGLTAELYINYDCDLYCANLFEDMVKLLSKNSLLATQAIFSVHQLSLDSLLAVVETIERNCVISKSGNSVVYKRHSRNNSRADGIDLNEQSQLPAIENSIALDHIKNYLTSNRGSDSRLSTVQLRKVKDRKRILTQGTELFNQRAEKGIQFLQENGLLNTTLDAVEVASFLRGNSGLDKKMIGEYVSKKKNVESKILEMFVKSFDFTNTTIDQSLRLYLESFRLPGEAPLIFLVMEHFADHWHKCNNEPFANTDAAFRLAYSIIMLNMDQHNHNAKRLNVPMTAEDFAKNLRGLNGNLDFDPEILANIYNSIKNDEIVMPAEQTGTVRDNYLWKMLLRRGEGSDGVFHHVLDTAHDNDLFQVIWGPTLAALSFMFDKTSDGVLLQRSLLGFSKCAAICAHYGLNAEFDALILTLCKFTTLLSVPDETSEISACVAFGQNVKAQLAIKAVFSLIHEYGDCVRESWRNVLEVVVQLFRLKLLPKGLTEVDDFCEVSGKFTLHCERPILQKADAGLLSSLYSYLSSDGQRQPSYDEQEIIKVSRRCIKDCQIEQIVADSKFLQFDSLNELVRNFIAITQPPTNFKSLGIGYADDVTVFLVELLIKILVQNRDRVLTLWEMCRDQLYALIRGGATCNYDYLLQRTTIALLKVASYLMRNEELCPVVLQSLKMFLTLKPTVVRKISKPISVGIFELLKTSAQNIHTESDWEIVFTLLEYIGAGAVPVDLDEVSALPGGVGGGTKSDGALSSEDDAAALTPDRNYTSDSELMTRTEASSPVLTATGENWILVNKVVADQGAASENLAQLNVTALAHPCRLLEHSPLALLKCWESLAFIVRNVAHITPYNFENCVKCIRTFVEACLNAGSRRRQWTKPGHHRAKKTSRQQQGKRDQLVSSSGKLSSSESDGGEDGSRPDRYQTIAIQLLDLMHTLHTRTAQIFRWWAEEGGTLPQCVSLWTQGWRPLLQGIARMAIDSRRQVRTSAITCLQRALLVHDLQTLNGPEWESCFKHVLFPLLNELFAEQPSPADPALLEESRMRAATIMSKVFLHHLTPLMELATFNQLWLAILDYLERFMRVGSDMLHEAMLESLKNMLLVMHSVRVFHTADGSEIAPLWDITWQKIAAFLPTLKDELFKELSVGPRQLSSESVPINVEAMPKSSIILTPPTNNCLMQPADAGAPPPPLLFPTVPEAVIVPSSVPVLLPHNLDVTASQQFTISQAYLGGTSPPQLFTATAPILAHPSLTIDNPLFVKSMPAPPMACPPEIQVASTFANTVNLYPNLSNVPPTMVQSFSPVSVQPSNARAPEDEIYVDYLNDPYNLATAVLPGLTAPGGDSEPNPCASREHEDVSSPRMMANVFQSSNYFGSPTGMIPPGSELLFGDP